jgi:hypothetical protein
MPEQYTDELFSIYSQSIYRAPEAMHFSWHTLCLFFQKYIDKKYNKVINSLADLDQCDANIAQLLNGSIDYKIYFPKTIPMQSLNSYFDKTGFTNLVQKFKSPIIHG